MDGKIVNRKLLCKAFKLENKEMLVDFAWDKNIPAEEVPLNVLVMKECDNVQIPVSILEVKKLMGISEKSTAVMTGGSNFVDNVSQRWDVDASQICSTTFKGLSLLSLALRYFPLPNELTNVTAQLQKLILIDNSGFSIHSGADVLVHGKIGTLILQLPVEGGHQGGNLNVEYKGRKKIFENHSRSDKNFYLSAFYNCCKYFTESVTQGFKLTLIFDLICTNPKISSRLELPIFFTALKQVNEALEPWTRQMDCQEETVVNGVICTKIKNEVDFENFDAKFKIHQLNQVAQLDSYQPDLKVSLFSEQQQEFYRVHRKFHKFPSEKKLKENVLFFILHEKYDINNFAFEFLRGHDRKMAGLLQNCVFLDVHLATAVAIPLKIKTDCRCLELSVANLPKQGNQEDIEISCLIDTENVTRNLSMALNWRTHFVGVLESEKEENGCSEDFGDQIEFAKKHLENGVLVIWPKHQSIPMYCHYGLVSFLNSVEKSIALIEWQEDSRHSALSNLRQLLSFCRAEPLRAWTTSGLGKGELTLRLLRFCITLRAREEGLDLLKFLGSNFDSENFEGIQNDEVAQAIADFVSQVSGWRDVAELIEPLLSCDRITKQLLPVMKLAKCLLRSNCVEGARMVGDSVSSFFAELDQTRALKSKEFEVEAYVDMIVELETNSDTCCQSRTASFILFFSEVRSSLQCRVLLFFEAQFNSQMENHESCKNLFYALCRKILSVNCNINVPPIKSIIVDLVRCFIRLGNAEFLKILISKICRVPDKIPEGFLLKNQTLVEKIISSHTIWESATSSEMGRTVMASLVDHHLTLMVHQLSCFKEDGYHDQISHPDNIKDTSDVEVVFKKKHLPCSLSSCIWFLMEMQENNDDEDSQCLPVRIRTEWKISLIMSKLDVHQLMQLLIDVLKEIVYSNKHLYSFGTHRTCQLFFARIKDQVTVMPRREAILELVNLFVQTGDETLTQSFLEHTCESEKNGIWSYHQKHKLFEMLVSSSEVWVILSSESKILVLKTCVDLAIVINDTFNSTSTLRDCVQLLFVAEKNQLSNTPSTTARIFLQLLTKISTPKLMELLLELQLSEKNEPIITNFPACTDWYLDAYRFFFKQDFVSFLTSIDGSEKKILNCLFWLNDDVCWKSFQFQLCRSFPSEEGHLFLQIVCNSETLQQNFLQDPLALNTFHLILDHWIKHSNPEIELPFTWRQPLAVLSEHPRVEIFLRSSQECMTYANFSDFSEARVFGEGLERRGPTNGFSVRAFPGGEGKFAYCEIVKNICHPNFFRGVIAARQSELDKLVKLRQDLNRDLFNSAQVAVQETSTVSSPILLSEETRVNPSPNLYVENVSCTVDSKEETAPVFTTDDMAVISEALEVASKFSFHPTFGLDDLTDLMPPIQENMQAYFAPLYVDTDPHFQVAGSSEWEAATDVFSSTPSASETVPIETLATSDLDDLNAASNACASETSTLGTEPMSMRSDETSNDGGRSESTDTKATDSRRVEEYKTMAPLQTTDDWVACADAWASGSKKATTTSRAKTFPCHSSWDVPSQMLTSSSNNAPTAIRKSWELDKTTKSRANKDLAPKADVGRVQGTRYLDKKPDDWASSSSNRNPCVSGANAFPVCDRRKNTANADPRICRKCNQRGHSFLKCPNDSSGGRTIEYSMQNREPTRCNVANRMETVDSCSVKRGQHTPYPSGVKPKENWEAVGDTLYSPSSRPGVPSTSGTSGVMRTGLNNWGLQQGNIAVPKRLVEVKMKWNLQEIQSIGKKDPLPTRGQFREMEPQNLQSQVPEIHKVAGISLNVMENSIPNHANPTLIDIRKRNSEVQIVAASSDFSKSLRTLHYPSSSEVCPVVWKGVIDGAEMGKFNVQALNIRNSTSLDGVSLPSSLTVVGRIRPERVWDYINQIKRAAIQDVVILKLIPGSESDREHYASFICQLQQRDRFAVVEPVSKHIRDFYLISLPKESAVPSALASLTSATKLLDRNRKSSLLVGIVIRSRIHVETGSGVIAVPPEMTDVSIKINPPEPRTSSMRNTNFIPGSSLPAGLIKIPNPQVNFSTLDIDMRTSHPPLPVTSDVLNTVDIGDLQKILKTVQNKDDNSSLRKRKYCDVVTDAEILSPKVVKVAASRCTDSVTSPITLPAKSAPSSTPTNSIYICTSWPNSSATLIAKNTNTGPQSTNVALYSPGLPMESTPAPIDEDLLEKRNNLMEELNSALPAWLRGDCKKCDDEKFPSSTTLK